MSKTLANAQTECRIYLDEAAQADFLDSEVTLAINRAYHNVMSHVIEIYEDFQETTPTTFQYAVVANKQEYTIDSSLIKVTRVEINFNPTVSGSQPARCEPIKQDEIRGNLANTNAAGSFYSPGYYLYGDIGSQTIGFVPIPTAGDTTGKSITVWGIALKGDLINTTDQILIPYVDNYVYLICLRASAQLLRKGQQEEATASRYMAEYNTGIIEMKQFLKDRQADDGWYIQDNTLEDIDFSLLGIV